MAIFGWKTANQARVYTRKARLRWLPGDAMHMIALDENESTECSHRPGSSGKIDLNRHRYQILRRST